MTDSEAFVFHFAELDRRGLDGPVPGGWEMGSDLDRPNTWARPDGENASGLVYADPKNPEPIDLQALAHVLTQALADAGNLTIHTTRDGTNTVTTPAFAVHRKPLLAALVTAYWRAQAAPSP